VASDKQEIIAAVTKGNINECSVNEVKHCVKERKQSYDQKHCQDVSWYPVDNPRILAFPTTHSTNSVDGWELGTKKGMSYARRGVVDWLLLMKIIIGTS